MWPLNAPWTILIGAEFRTMLSETCISCHCKAHWTVADPGFPRGWGANPPGGANIRFCQNFPKTAWNWKNLDGGGGRRPLRSTNAEGTSINLDYSNKIRKFRPHGSPLEILFSIINRSEQPIDLSKDNTVTLIFFIKDIWVTLEFFQHS